MISKSQIILEAKGVVCNALSENTEIIKAKMAPAKVRPYLLTCLSVYRDVRVYVCVRMN